MLTYKFERPQGARFDRRASCSVSCSSHTFEFISCNFILKLKSILYYFKCELHFLNDTKCVLILNEEGNSFYYFVKMLITNT